MENRPRGRKLFEIIKRGRGTEVPTTMDLGKFYFSMPRLVLLSVFPERHRDHWPAHRHLVPHVR